MIADSTHAATLPDSHSSKIRTVVNLVAIPLASLDVAQLVISKHAARQARYRQSVTSLGSVLSGSGRKKVESDSSSESSDEEDGDEEVEEADAAPVQPTSTPKRPFWQRAFSRNRSANPTSQLGPDLSTNASPSADTKGQSSTRDDPNEASPPKATDSASLADVAAEATNPSQAEEEDADVRESQKELDDKLVAETLRTFRGLYFSFETDVTRTLQNKATEPKGQSFDHLPLWRRADKRFWFNAHLISSFVAAGVSSHFPLFVKLSES